jgi:hypothetical protein
MKSKLIIKFLLLLASGALFGQFVQSDHDKWHRLGREAFLSNQAHRFDLYMANPGIGTKYFVVSVVFALGFGVLYEGIAYVGAKLIDLFLSPKAPSNGNS